MAQGLTAGLILACGLVLGPLLSTSHHVTSKTYGSLRATLSWAGELRTQNGDGGKYSATLMGPASLRITAPGLEPQQLSLEPFLLKGAAYTPVGPSGGCGAGTDLAIVPKAGSPLPYVVAFVVLAEKGCLPVPIVFVPLRNGSHYAYVGAPYFAMWWSKPKTTSQIRVESIDRVSLPSASLGFGPRNWTVVVVTNALSTGPRVAVFEPPDKPKQIQPGQTILLGDYYSAWFVTK
jgi:hypothetical protein